MGQILVSMSGPTLDRAATDCLTDQSQCYEALNVSHVRAIAHLVPVAPVNPYQRRLAEELSKLGLRVSLRSDVKAVVRTKSCVSTEHEVLHLHWLFNFQWNVGQLLRLFFYIFRLWTLKRRRVRIVWTAHNLYAHETACRLCDRLVTSVVMRFVSGIIVHSPIAKDIVAGELLRGDTSRVHVIPHGNYIGSYPNSISRPEARKRLEIANDELVIGLIGNLRPYKGLEQLIETFRTLPDADLKLMIAGKPSNEEFEAHLTQLVSEDDRIMFKPGRIQDEDMQIYFNASNVVAFPYREILTSGALVLAMSFGRACVAPRLGSIPDYIDASCGVLYDDVKQGITAGLQQVIEMRDSLDAMGRRAYERARQWEWRDIALATLEPYGVAMEAKEVALTQAAKARWWPAAEQHVA